MKQITRLRWNTPLVVSGVLLGLLALLQVPVEQRIDGPRPVLRQEASLLLTQNMTIQQTAQLDAPVVDQIAFRVWARVEGNVAPQLRAQCVTSAGPQPFVAVPIPPGDGAYHALRLPWCDAPNQRDVGLALDGAGLRLLITASDRFPGTLMINRNAQRNSDLVVQLQQRTAGIDRYLPVSQWAAGKPGVVGAPHLYLLLVYLYVVLILGILRRIFVQPRQTRA